MKDEDFKGILEGIDDAAALIGGQKKSAHQGDIQALREERRDKRIERSVKYGLIISDR